MKLYNSATKKIEEFKPKIANEVNMYVCGPTVYNYPHIGNARPMVVFDTLKKTLEAFGYVVKYVSNFTDVDDKIINKAIDENISEKEVADKYIKAYNEDRKSLNVDIPNSCPRVTNTMNEIINFIEKLEDEGFAYNVDGDVYFRVSKITDYGKISGQKLEDLSVGARIDENDKKENPLDFTLWKKTDKGIKWNTRWGEGRPGWHTECVVMINNEFSSSNIDIHGGGMDLKFPHHENERAQNIALNDMELANYWVHNGMVNIDGSKMSKSIGNVIWAKDFVEKFGSNLVRWLLLSVNYRAPLNISEETINGAKKELTKIEQCMKQANLKLQLADEFVEEYDEESYEKFLNEMSDDLNTPNAYKVVFDTIKIMNNLLRQKEVDLLKISKYFNSVNKMLYILGIKLNLPKLTNEEKNIYDNWEEAKREKRFDDADKFREILLEKGII